MTLEVGLALAVLAIWQIAFAICVMRQDSKNHKHFMELCRIQNERWLLTEQFHQAIVQMIQETAHQQSLNPPQQQNQPNDGSRTYTVWH